MTPRWDALHPSITVTYETTNLSSSDQLIPLETYIPTGWAWRELEINGPNLVSWSSTDVPGFNVRLHDDEEDGQEEEGEGEGPDDSFSTIRHLRPNPPAPQRPQLRTHTSASLMKQTLPVAGDHTVDDFSFEMTSSDHLTIPASTGTSIGSGSGVGVGVGGGGGSGSGTSRPGTPARGSPGLTARSLGQRGEMNHPVPARCFDLIFGRSDEDRSYTIEGTLVPLPLTFVSGSQPLDIPFIKSPSSSSSGECTIICPKAIFVTGDKEEGICDTSLPSIGSFTWTDAYGSPIRPSAHEPIRGNVRVRLQRGQWGMISISILFPWSGRNSELAFSLSGETAPKITKAVVGGVDVPRSLRPLDGGGGYEVRLGQGSHERTGKMVEVVLELEELENLPLPHLEGAEGEMIVEFRGDDWSCMFLPLPLTSYHPIVLILP